VLHLNLINDAMQVCSGTPSPLCGLRAMASLACDGIARQAFILLKTCQMLHHQTAAAGRSEDPCLYFQRLQWR
jgi:hypothetical protein